MNDGEQLPLIGRDYTLIENLAKQTLNGMPHGTLTTNLRPTLDRRGFRFDVKVTDSAGVPTGHIARVEIKLNRMDS